MSDPRLTPIRDGRPITIARGRASLRHAPTGDAMQDNELLFGEPFILYEEKAGWAWGRCGLDGYVGYLHTIVCGEAIVPDHRVTALATPLLTGPDIKSATRDMLPLNARVKVLAGARDFVRIAPDGFVFAGHLAPLDRVATDWVATAERFVGTSYVWGGKTHAGLDCSGLVQTSLASAGIAAPRDADQQEAALGEDCSHLARRGGDLVFWNGHVAIMLDETRLIHANAFHMQVEIEPLVDAVTRIAPIAGPVTAVKRF